MRDDNKLYTKRWNILLQIPKLWGIFTINNYKFILYIYIYIYIYSKSIIKKPEQRWRHSDPHGQILTYIEHSSYAPEK